MLLGCRTKSWHTLQVARTSWPSGECKCLPQCKSSASVTRPLILLEELPRPFQGRHSGDVMRHRDSIRVGSFLTVQCVILCLASFGYAPVHWQTVARLTFNWNGRPNVQAILEAPEVRGEATHFTRIRIQVPGENQFVLNNAKGWAKLRFRYHNPLRSDFMLAVKAPDGRMSLVVLGFSDAGLPESLDVIELPSTGEPRVVLHSGTLGVWELKDLDGDGNAEMVTYTCSAEDIENGLPANEPFEVYRLGAVPGQTPQVSIPLTREYNIDHYDKWLRINYCQRATGRRKQHPSVIFVVQMLINTGLLQSPS